MPKFSELSLRQLETCHPDLQRLFKEVIKHFDCRIVEGHRGRIRQNELYEIGKSKVDWPNSRHNSYPSEAVDVVPYPVVWEDTKRMYLFCGFVLGLAKMMEIPIRLGADWDGDTEVRDQKFNDLPHFELLKARRLNPLERT